MFSELKATGELYHLMWLRNLAALIAVISGIVCVTSGIVTLRMHFMLQHRIAEIKAQLPH
jgi:hypothetical protein